ncbi:MAG: 2-isopropylmalate synthase [Clostridiaceae bacterium]|jgi:2-isopropylmalate synthase|nr:2-isopropylmalate synthase [Clostridiaceae bacterium]
MNTDFVKIFDTTLRDGEQSPGCSMTLHEKLDIAEALERLRIDVIEAGFPAASPGDFRAVSEIAALVKTSVVAGLSRLVKNDIDATYGALKNAVSPRLHLFIATSPVHLKYKLRMTEEQVLTAIRENLAYARTMFSDIEFSFEDATRTPLPFLTLATETAIAGGASTINLPDTVGYCMPQEITEMFSHVIANAKGADKVTFSAHVHDDLGMAVANSLAAVKAGARQVEGTINGIGERAGNAALEEVIMAIRTRKEFFGAYTGINTKELYNASKLVSAITGIRIPPNKAIIGANAFVHASGIHQHGILAERSTYEIMNPEDIGLAQTKLQLGKHSGKHAFREVLEEMGYSFEDAQLAVYFQNFKELADKKKTVSRKDIEALLLQAGRRRSERVYALEGFDINSYKGGASADITLMSEGKTISEKMSGDGPVDAAFLAVNSITGYDFALVDYAVHAVSEGKDALGEAVVKLSLNGNTRTGKGHSTDVLEASIKAYINAANKIISEQKGNS